MSRSNRSLAEEEGINDKEVFEAHKKTQNIPKQEEEEESYVKNILPRTTACLFFLYSYFESSVTQERLNIVTVLC